MQTAVKLKECNPIGLTPRQLEYQEYLKSDHWAKLREEVFARDGRKCTRCPSFRPLHCHHTLYRQRFYDTIVPDCITLCETCHQIEHGIVPAIRIYRGSEQREPITNMKELHAARRNRLISRAEFELRKKLLGGGKGPRHSKKRNKGWNSQKARGFKKSKQQRQAWLRKRRNWSF